jgi:hypothetical protein
VSKLVQHLYGPDGDLRLLRRYGADTLARAGSVFEEYRYENLEQISAADDDAVRCHSGLVAPRPRLQLAKPDSLLR